METELEIIFNNDLSLNKEFIRKFKDKVNWIWISSYQKMDEDFIREFQDKVNWKEISIYQELNEDFIREFKDKVDWYYISIHQKLNENFIREFQDKVDWYYIHNLLDFGYEFIKEFKNKINFSYILEKNGYCIRKIKNIDLTIDEIKYIIYSNDYNSNELSFNEFVDLAIRLIKLKVFQ